MTTATKTPVTQPMNNSDQVSLVWFDGDFWIWHLYVPFAKSLTASGSAETETAAHVAAAMACPG